MSTVAAKRPQWPVLSGLGFDLVTTAAAFAAAVFLLYQIDARSPGDLSARAPVAPPFVEVSVNLPGANPVWVGREEISYALWAQCHAEGGCSYLPKPQRAHPAGEYPVTEVNYLDISEFIAWLNRKTGLGYRLLSIEEWRALAGPDSARIRPRRFTDPRLDWAAEYGTTKTRSRKIRASGSFGVAANGVADLSGNVWEWTSTCAGADPDRCPAYLAAGDHEAQIPIFLRDAYGGGCSAGQPPTHLGFRLVRDR